MTVPEGLVALQETRWAAIAATAASIATSMAAGPSGATDMQTMVVGTLSRCGLLRSGCGTASSNVSSAASTSGKYLLATPFALSDSPGGVLAGNSVVVGSVLLVTVLASLRNPPAVEAETDVISKRLSSFLTRLGNGRCPGFALLVVVALHQSTLYGALQLAALPSTQDKALGIVSAVLVAIVIPAGALILASRLPRQFVKYTLPPLPPTPAELRNQHALDLLDALLAEPSAGAPSTLDRNRKHPEVACATARASSATPAAWYSRHPLAAQVLVPYGITMPPAARQLASVVITGFRVPSLLCVASPFLSALAVNIVASEWFPVGGHACTIGMALLAVLHGCMALAIARWRFHRTAPGNVLGCLGMLITAGFFAQLAAGVQRGLDATLTAQAGLSLLRCVVAVAVFLAERSLETDPRVGKIRGTVGDALDG